MQYCIITFLHPLRKPENRFFRPVFRPDKKEYPSHIGSAISLTLRVLKSITDRNKGAHYRTLPCRSKNNPRSWSRYYQVV